MSFKEARKVALITGCSEPSSLGACLARELLSRGWRVFATARKVETLKGLAEEGCDVLPLDVTSDDSVKVAVGSLSKATHGRLDLLVNNAGVSGWATVLDLDISRVQALYDVNVFGALRMIQACSSLLIETANDATLSIRKTTVMNIGSVARYMYAMQSAYGSSKAAFGHISDTLRVELAPLGVKVITVEPALIRTAMTDLTKVFPVRLPEDQQSPYYPTFDSVLSKNFTKGANNGADPVAVAKQLVNMAVAKKPPGQTIVGQSAFLIKWIYLRLPFSWQDAVWTKIVGFNTVKYADRRIAPTKLSSEQEESEGE